MRRRPRRRAHAYRGCGKLEGRAALITGGGSGIGRAVAVLYAREGANVALVHGPEDARVANQAARAVAAEGRRCELIAGDVRDPAFCERAVVKALRALGRLDVLVNNAAYRKHCARLEDLPEEQIERTFRTNIFGFFHMARAALPHLPKGGAIVNCGSTAGLEGNPELLDYAATKGAIHAFTKSLARNLVGRGIRVNCVAPGPAQPEGIAPAFVYFASNADSSDVTGEVLSLVGGETTAG